MLSSLFLVPVAIAILNLLCWWKLRAGPPAGSVAWRVPRPALLIAGAFVAVFVVLCANEMFGNPPLMTTSFRPPASMVGEWRATTPPAAPAWKAIDVVFAIHPDGSVTGSVGDAAVIGGRMANNRSWFGKLMNWREEYAISGGLDHAVRASERVVFAGQFTGPLTMREGDLRGTLFFGRPGLNVTLRKE